MRWTIALGLVAGLAVGFAVPVQAADTITHTFSYDPNNPNNAEGYRQFEGHIRGGRSAQSPAGYNDSNWSGGDSMQVFSPETSGTRHGIMQVLGWEDEVGGLPITNASIKMHLRFNANAPGTEDMEQAINVSAMLVPVNIGNGDGLAPPDAARPDYTDRGMPNQDMGWMTYEHRVADIMDVEAGGSCTTCVGWGDGSGREGPVAGIDYSSDVTARSVTAPNFADEESPDRDGDNVSDYYPVDIDLTPIFQWWQAGNTNNGLHFWGETGDAEADPPTANTRLYLHGSDTPESGWPGAIGLGNDDFQRPRRFAVLSITTVPEPATLGLLCLGGLVALRRTRR